MPYNGEDNNDYVDGKGFCCNDGSLEAAQARAMARAMKNNFQEGDSYEKMQFYYHPDHLGSSSYITNLEGEVVQQIEYVPFGEVFVEERNNIWNTPYLFNAKEFDEESGLYYYGARYYEPRLSLWISCDPKEEDYPMLTTYSYVNNNPVIFIDPHGLDSYYTMDGVYLGGNNKKTQYVYVVSSGGYKQYKKGRYVITLNKATQLRDNKNNPITKDDFKDLAGTLYAEMSYKNNTWLEAAAIYSVLENRGKEDGKTTLQVASGGGVYGYSERSKISDKYAPKNLVQNAYKGLIHGMLDNKDYSNGGYFWHGRDFHINTARAYKDYYKVGFHFTSKSHDIWHMGDSPSPPNSKWAYQYESTAAYGGTTFMRLSNKWMQYNHSNHWSGGRKR